MTFAIAAIASFAVIALLLAVPVEVEFDAAWPDTEANTVIGRWGFGVLRFRFRLDNAKDESAASGQERKAARRSRAPAGRDGTARVLRALRQRPFRRRLLRFAGSLWRAVHTRDVDVSIRAGTGDPADTGCLWGALGPLSAWLQTFPDCRVTLEPDFVEATAEVCGRGRITVFPLQILWLVGGLLVSPTIWRGMAGRSA